MTWQDAKVTLDIASLEFARIVRGAKGICSDTWAFRMNCSGSEPLNTPIFALMTNTNTEYRLLAVRIDNAAPE
jgi:hypothetical protein